MPASQRQGGNSQTLCVVLSELHYEAVEENKGYATVIRFRLHDIDVKMGDVLLVLEGAEIRFHGLIGKIDEAGWGIAADRRGSTIPITIH
jgi:hypothetical protein